MAVATKNNRTSPRSLSPLNRSSTDCTHCGLGVPAGLIEPEQLQQFCCRGCRAAYALIHSCGLDAFYQMTENVTDRKDAAGDLTFNRDFGEFDVEGFVESFGERFEDGTNRIRFALDGIHCAACIWLIEKLPRLVPGVLEANVNWSKSIADIRWHDGQTELSTIARTLAQLGYTPHPLSARRQESARVVENRRHLVRLAVAGAAAGNNMLIAAALYFGMFQTMTANVEILLRWSSCLVGLVSLLFPGQVFLRGAISAIRTRTPHMDLPIALGLSVAGTSGVINTVLNHGEVYFDSISALVFLLLLGRWIQYRQQLGAADAIELLHQVTPQMTRRIADGKAIPLPIRLVKDGDVLQVLSGEVIPVDGIVSLGNTAIDESILTGESVPRAKRIGDRVCAGTLNLRDGIQVQATKVGSETRIGILFDLIERSLNQKPRIVQWADRIGGWFVVTILVLAISVFAAWLLIDASHAIDRSVALLIVACPCALALATPLAISVAIGRAARRGILIKSGDVLQQLDKPGEIWLDKTGTLTQGRMRVIDWIGDEEIQPAVLAIEQTTSHPIAVAICEYLCSTGEISVREEAATAGRTMKVVQTDSGGIRAVFDGQSILIGNAHFVTETEIDRRFAEAANEVVAHGASPVFVSVDGEIRAIIGVGDPLRDDAKSAIEMLQAKGWQVGILSGDHVGVVNKVGQQLRLDVQRCLGAMMPEQKVEWIQQRMKQVQTVVMVGDGVNDSAALAAATVGIAAHGGAQASLQAAPVYLNRPGLAAIIQLFEGGQKTMRTIERNFAASLTYNLLAVCLAACGWINPLFAAILMPISSITVVSLSLSSKAFSHIGTRNENLR